MNSVFVDTSALFALIVSDDQKHDASKRVFDELAEDLTPLTSSSYVLVETFALLQRRAGRKAVAAMRENVAPLLDIVWVDRALHEAGLDRLSQSRSKHLSLVDCVSFEIMRRQSIAAAFAFDRHFSAAGFDLL